MFARPPTPRTATAALAIPGACGSDGLPRARGAIAAGPVLIRGGDYFGPVVNPASRLVDTAAVLQRTSALPDASGAGWTPARAGRVVRPARSDSPLERRTFAPGRSPMTGG